MKVLIGVDGSAGSLQAVRFASRLLSAERDEIVLYYSPPEVTVRSGSKPDEEVLTRMRNTMTEAVFDKARVELPTALDVKTSTIVGTRSAKHGLLVQADESRADMIVVGARGAGPLPRLAIGSVGRAVVHAATIPVMVVRGNPRADEGLNLLLACDGTDASKHARACLSKMSLPGGTAGRVITVIDSGLAGNMPPWLEEHLHQAEVESEPDAVKLATHIEEERKHAHASAVQWCGELPSEFQQHEPIVKQGHASQEILNTINAEDIDLVVVGARRLSPIGRWLMGSTSEHLLSHAPCSMLIARLHEKS